MRKLIAQMLDLCREFWGRAQSWQAWLFLLLILAMGMSIVYLNVLINNWSKTFYDALGEFNGGLLYSLVKEYCVYILIYIGVFVYQEWFTKLLIIRWRAFLTERFINGWLAQRAFYRLSLSGRMDNPDQRIAQDIDLFVTQTVRLSVSFIITFAQLFSFLFILWQLSGVQHFSLWGHEITLHGYLVWVALIYNLAGSLITHAIGKKLHGINYHKQRVEADFRAALLRKHDNAEQIALYGGEQQEKNQLRHAFSAIAANWRRVMNGERDLGLFTVGYTRVSLIVPVFAALPAFLSKTVTLGGLMQIRSAFGQVHGALSWFIHFYYSLVELSASLERLSQFQQEIARHQSGDEPVAQGECLSVEALSFSTPQGQPLLRNVAFSCAPGSWSRLSGRSGLGKSTLLRTLSGLWPYYQGRWQALSGKSLLLPQQSYLGQGTLAELLCYPEAPIADRERLRQALDSTGLAAWRDKLDERLNWERVFSGGERQRLAFARALIVRPDTLYLDEATSNLDPAGARAMLTLIKTALPDCTVIAITHQDELDEFFPQHYDLNAFSQP
ncbi:ABC transporter ATP-binding protein/permease [Affinibrenneria salicis]|uniref:ABC transporter ATP-binding protein/permease n=1 Tax=Affinibrenneria salicis TaxID=2590031 RepID=A0A5J5G818_9GAMM|nr:ABC transporter ATP-binding protein/permease [Affinibrenneria salicis]KAA9002528.1 ABC transporter ATP-binding protein/permease [Affinibrenneria salicis]KAA9003184.1 ABC transporter ATP-binding protein/permease [Affinibrenneria salicis]